MADGPALLNQGYGMSESKGWVGCAGWQKWLSKMGHGSRGSSGRRDCCD